MNENYSIGRVYSRAWAQLKWNFWPVLGFVAIAYIAGSTISSLVTLPFSIGMAAFSLPTGGSNVPPDPAAIFSSPAFLGVITVSLLLSLLNFAALYAGGFHAYATLREGQKVDIGDLFPAALRKMLPLMGVSLIVTLGTLLGYALLIIPGIILALLWSVAMPALVAENLGVMESLKRSAALTKGCKRWIFLTYLVLMAAAVGVYVAVVVVVIAVVAGVAAGVGSGAPSAGLIIIGVIFAIIAIFALLAGVLVFLMYFMSLQASIYRETRLVHEGVAGHGLQDVFQ